MDSCYLDVINKGVSWIEGILRGGDIFEWENDPTSERSYGNVSVANYRDTSGRENNVRREQDLLKRNLPVGKIREEDEKQ